MANDMEVTSSSAAQASSALLPPCRVCGEKASGFHYGANTCEACKGFFRRSLQRKEVYKCIGEGDCEVGPGKRSTCAHCRYRKCLTVGMAKSAIKTGRYTHEKKTRDIREVKRLQLQEKLKSEGKAFIFPESREQELEQIVRHITTVHQQQTPHTPEFFEKLPEREQEFLEQRELQREMFGTMRPLPRDEYMQIYNSTGIDIDGRREMIKHMIPCIEKAIKRFISFAKALPGFKDLPIDDQIALIKVATKMTDLNAEKEDLKSDKMASRFEAWMVSSHRAFNPETRLFTHVCGYTVHIEEMARLYSMTFLEMAFTVAGRMKQLQMTIEEECALKGLAILSGDRCDLESSWKVDEHQVVMLEALEFVIKNRHRKDCIRIAKMINLLADLRTLSELHREQEEKIGTEWSREIRFPPLVYEIFST